MTHDPMCDSPDDWGPATIDGPTCSTCRFIAKVREDESSHPKRTDRHITYGYELGFNDAVVICIFVAEATAHEDQCCSSGCCCGPTKCDGACNCMSGHVSAGIAAQLRALLEGEK